MRDHQKNTGDQQSTEKLADPGTIPENQHTSIAETTDIADGRQEATTTDTSSVEQNPRDPNVMQGYPNREKEVPIIGDLYQKRSDGIITDTHEQNRINAPNEERPTQSVNTHKRRRRVRTEIKGNFPASFLSRRDSYVAGISSKNDALLS